MSRMTREGHAVESRTVRSLRGGSRTINVAACRVRCNRGREHAVEIIAANDSQVRAGLAGLQQLEFIAADGGKLVCQVAPYVTIERTPVNRLSVRVRANGYTVTTAFRTVRHAEVWGTLSAEHLNSQPHRSERRRAFVRGF